MLNEPIELPYEPTETVCQVIENFINSDEIIYRFPASLTNTQRKEVHNLSSHFNLQHVSTGIGNERYITIGKANAFIGIHTSQKQLNADLVNASTHVIKQHPSVEEVLAKSLKKHQREVEGVLKNFHQLQMHLLEF